MKTKKSFVLYHDYWNWFRLLTNEEIGLVLRGIFYYEKERVFPEFLTDKTLLVFQMIKESLDKDREKYENICNKNRENAKLRWNKYEDGEN
ncbi:MAG: hypothetical protein IKW03_07630 [Clostridia bacterium]|nr:hypothetical protein [Clostridia bacterium]